MSLILNRGIIVGREQCNSTAYRRACHSADGQVPFVVQDRLPVSKWKLQVKAAAGNDLEHSAGPYRCAGRVTVSQLPADTIACTASVRDPRPGRLPACVHSRMWLCTVRSHRLAQILIQRFQVDEQRILHFGLLPGGVGETGACEESTVHVPVGLWYDEGSLCH
jgi:hypothetical protein